MLPTLTMGSTIEKLHCQGHQRYIGDVYQPRFDTQSSYWLVVPCQPCPRRLTMRSSNGARERPSEHQMMIFSARPYRGCQIGPYSRLRRPLVSFLNTCTAVLLCTASVNKIEMMIYNRSVHGHRPSTGTSLLTCYAKPSTRPSDGRLTYGGGSRRKLTTCFIAGVDHDFCAWIHVYLSQPKCSKSAQASHTYGRGTDDGDVHTRY